jgi:two-component system chemotaxis response regulator CheB
LEVIPKPDTDASFSRELIAKIKLLAKVKVISHIRRPNPLLAGDNSSISPLGGDTVTEQSRSKGVGSPLQMENRSAETERIPSPARAERIVAIASSTGGPRALHMLLSRLPKDFPWPVVIAQHIAEDFVSGMVEWLDKSISLKVKIGQSGEKIQPSTVYFSPSEKHMKIDTGKRIAFCSRRPQDIYFPSCNTLLSSVAGIYGKNSIGIILTGMGDDGIAGMKDIRSAGGLTLAQDEKSSVVFGMPRVAIESGCIDKILPIDKMADEILALTHKKAG